MYLNEAQERRCRWCKRWFTPNDDDQKFCTARHRKELVRKRRRARGFPLTAATDGFGYDGTFELVRERA